MRLIDADALKKQFEDRSLEDFTHLHFIDAIDNAPTVELDESIIQAVLNKRCMTAVTNEYLVALHGKRPTGKWIYHHKGPSESRECSVCGVWLDWSLVRNSFCPNCGADMRKKVE